MSHKNQTVAPTNVRKDARKARKDGASTRRERRKDEQLTVIELFVCIHWCQPKLKSTRDSSHDQEA